MAFYFGLTAGREIRVAQRLGLVLAGGKGRRLGRTKGDLPSGDTTLARRAARILWNLCGDVLISVGPGLANPAPGFRCIEDGLPGGRGPLAGIDAAFRSTRHADLLVMACDYPRVDEAMLRKLLGCARPEDDLVMVSDDRGRDHPLVGLWRRTTAPRVAEALENGQYKVRALLGEWNVRRLGAGELQGVDLAHALLNVNWPDDLDAMGGRP